MNRRESPLDTRSVLVAVVIGAIICSVLVPLVGCGKKSASPQAESTSRSSVVLVGDKDVEAFRNCELFVKAITMHTIRESKPPTSLLEVERFITPRKDWQIDPWGKPYQFRVKGELDERKVYVWSERIEDGATVIVGEKP